MPTGKYSSKEAAGAQGAAGAQKSLSSHPGQLLREENCPLFIVHLCGTLLASRFNPRLYLDVVTAKRSFKLNLATGLQVQS